MAASISTPAGSNVSFRPQQGGQGVEGEAEEGEGAEEQTGAVHHSDSGGRIRLDLHLRVKWQDGAEDGRDTEHRTDIKPEDGVKRLTW